jgi:hypothetical protein
MLKRAVDRYGPKQWRQIAEEVPRRTALQCLHRWTKILRPGLKKGPWTPDEDALVIDWTKKNGTL